MGIDQTRDEESHPARSIRCLGWNRLSISARVPTAAMRAPANRHGAIRDHASLSIHRDDIACADQIADRPARPTADSRQRTAYEEDLKERSIERPRKQLFHPKRLRLSVQVHQHHLDVAAELPQDLPADPQGGVNTSVSAATAIRRNRARLPTSP